MKKQGLNDKWARIIGIPLISLLIHLFSNDPWKSLPLNIQLIKIVKNLFFVFIYWETNRIIFIYLRNKYPNYKDTAKKVVVQTVIFIAFILFAALVITFVDQAIPNEERESFRHNYVEIAEKSAILLGIITMSYECVYFFSKWEHSLYESERLKKESLISQFELLKNQISPHFLFNSLNALISLVPEDAELSILFIQKLSNVYRHVLNYNEKNVIDMDVEMQFLCDYIFLYKIRFGEKLIIKYQLPENFEQIQVVPFTLQMLVENAIKHNVISNKNPLHILISSDGKNIIVKNNLQKKTSGVESTNTGLNNIVNRYKLLTNKVVEVIVTTTEFSVSLPLLPVQN